MQRLKKYSGSSTDAGTDGGCISKNMSSNELLMSSSNINDLVSSVGLKNSYNNIDYSREESMQQKQGYGEMSNK